MILEHIKVFGSITPLEALNHYGCLRLSARIWDLRNNGHNIQTHMVNDTKSIKHYAKYTMS